MKRLTQTLMLALPLLLGTVAVHADTLKLPAAPVKGAAPARVPHRGMTMAQVKHQFGEPSKRYPTVGGHYPHRPPITRWDYPGFSVFFAKTHVVDTVVPARPPKLRHVKQLESH